MTDDPEKILEFVADGDGSRLDAWLAAKCAPDLSRSRIRDLIDSGAVTVNGAPATPKYKAHTGDAISLTLPEPEPIAPEPEDIPLDIVYEDSDIIVVNKQADLVVHPAPGHSGGTLVNALLYHCGDLAGIGGELRPGIVHRLDKDTTGLMVAAKNELSLNGLAAQFQDGRTRKTYLALVHGVVEAESGRIETTIGRHPSDRKKMAVNAPRGKNAVSNWKVAARYEKCTLMRVTIETGRTHQIRVHMAHIGHPVVGDQVYGKRSLDKLVPGCPARQLLHAAEFSFYHPRTNEHLEFQAAPPPDFQTVLANLR